MRSIRRLVVVPVLLLLIGCTHVMTPDASRPFEPIKEFSSTASVELQNGQPNKERVQFGQNGAHKFVGDYHAWTDAAIQIATRELNKRGVSIVAGAPKTIMMSIDSSHTDVGMVEIKSEITMRVKTSDGYSAVYIGDNGSYMMASIPRQLDGALMRVVREMFMDPH